MTVRFLTGRARCSVMSSRLTAPACAVSSAMRAPSMTTLSL
jgi:hypothetical protein